LESQYKRYSSCPEGVTYTEAVGGLLKMCKERQRAVGVFCLEGENKGDLDWTRGGG